MSELITIISQQIGHTLTKDLVSSYSCSLSSNKRVSIILEELLAYQEIESVILGGVDAILDQVIAVNISWLDIWEACKIIRNTSGGFLYVDLDPDDPLIRRLWLTSSLGEDKGQQVRLGKNLTGISHITDYVDLCNRLYPVGSGDLSLSSKTYTKVAISKSADAIYGYLKLKEEYGAYNGWTGEGDARPANVFVYKPTGAWITATGHAGSPGWNSLTEAYDGNWSTAAIYPFFPGWWPYAWTPYITLTYPSTGATQVKFSNQHVIKDIYIGAQLGGIIQVEIYYGGAWHEVYYAENTNDDIITASFAEQDVTSVRYRAYNTGIKSWFAQLAEMPLWDSTGWTDDSSHWVQGEDERTIRCAIGYYDEDVEYVITYTHAAYLIALDEIDSRDEIFSKKFDFDTADVDSLLALSRVKLVDLKIPIISISTDLIDLSVGEGKEFEELTLGSIIKVIDENLGIEEKAMIVGLNRPDLYHPRKLTIDVIGRAKDIIDYLKGI